MKEASRLLCDHHRSFRLRGNGEKHLDIATIHGKIWENRLRCHCYLQRQLIDSIVRRVAPIKSEGKKGSGRSKKNSAYDLIGSVSQIIVYW